MKTYVFGKEKRLRMVDKRLKIAGAICSLLFAIGMFLCTQIPFLEMIKVPPLMNPAYSIVNKFGWSTTFVFCGVYLLGVSLFLFLTRNETNE